MSRNKTHAADYSNVERHNRSETPNRDQMPRHDRAFYERIGRHSSDAKPSILDTTDKRSQTD